MASGARRSGLALDGCRWSLDALVREAERRNLRLGMSLSGTPWGVPSPREGLELAAEYDRARVGLVLDAARLAVLRRLGLAISGERLASLRAATGLVIENEAVGVDAGYLPGLGERKDHSSRGARRRGGGHDDRAARPPRFDRRRGCGRGSSQR